MGSDTNNKVNPLIKGWTYLIGAPFFLMNFLLTWPAIKVMQYDLKSKEKKQQEQLSQETPKIGLLTRLLLIPSYLISLPIAIVGILFNFGHFLDQNGKSLTSESGASKAFGYFLRFLSNTVFLPVKIVNTLLVRPILTGTGMGCVKNVIDNLIYNNKKSEVGYSNALLKLNFNPAMSLTLFGTIKIIANENLTELLKTKKSLFYYDDPIDLKELSKKTTNSKNKDKETMADLMIENMHVDQKHKVHVDDYDKASLRHTIDLNLEDDKHNSINLKDDNHDTNQFEEIFLHNQLKVQQRPTNEIQNDLFRDNHSSVISRNSNDLNSFIGRKSFQDIILQEQLKNENKQIDF